LFTMVTEKGESRNSHINLGISSKLIRIDGHL
jgi:hypothetical protein